MFPVLKMDEVQTLQLNVDTAMNLSLQEVSWSALNWGGSFKIT
jgi:hypothetical protein